MKLPPIKPITGLDEETMIRASGIFWWAVACAAIYVAVWLALV